MREVSVKHEHFDGENYCRDCGGLGERADKKHAADQDFNDAKITDGKRCETRPAFLYCLLERYAIFDKVPPAEVDKDASEHNAQERVRKKGKEHGWEKVQHSTSVYHEPNMNEAENQVESGAHCVFVALENVRSAHNVGSIFRTADGAGATGLYLIGTTPAPTDRFGRPQADIAKTALGAEKTLPWAYFETVEAFLKEMKEKGLALIAVEQDERAVDYKEIARFFGAGDLVLVFGNEVSGISRELLDVTNQVISIPMRGAKESLNVAVAAGVVLYQLLDGAA